MTPGPRRSSTALWLWGPVVLQMAIIFAASSIPNLGPLPHNVSDKTAHLIGYGILGAALLRALAGGRLAGVSWPRALAAFAIALLYAVSDELHQRFVPGRSSDLLDIVADGVGAMVAVALGGAAAGARAWGILNFLRSRSR